ncbi:MAG: helix-turn-helix transcriptional regulator, partial [Pseudonocardia sp.]
DLVRGTDPEDPLGASLQISREVASGRGELDGAGERLGLCGRILARTGDLRRIAITSAGLGHLARARGDYDAAAVHHERAGRLHDRLGNDNGVAWADYDLGLLARRRGRLPAAARHLRAALSRFRESGYTWAVGCATWAIATVELRRDRPGEAAALVAEAMAGFAAVDDRRGIAQCLEAAAAVARARRRSGDAARLLGAAAALRDRLAAPLPEEDRDQLDGVVRGVRGDLGPDAADRARCVGRALSQADAVALARRTVAGPPPGCRQAAPLTPREREVAGLVAGGRTNRQIGRALGITEKTAEVHVHNIIRKLDASSRAEIAAWAATQIVPS